MRQPCQDRPDYPELIASCRLAAGLSRAELAVRANVTPSTIELWETPSYEGIDLSILQRVAQATGTTLALDFRPTEPITAVTPRAALPTPERDPKTTSPRAPQGASRQRRSRAWLDLLDPKVA